MASPPGGTPSRGRHPTGGVLPQWLPLLLPRRRTPSPPPPGAVPQRAAPPGPVPGVGWLLHQGKAHRLHYRGPMAGGAVPHYGLQVGVLLPAPDHTGDFLAAYGVPPAPPQAP